MKEIMKRAWHFARLAESRFGGRASQYIAGALRMAWDEMKHPEKKVADDEKAIRLGHVVGHSIDALGEDESVGELSITRETAKALMVSFVGKTTEKSFGETETYDSNWTAWLPKSQLRKVGDRLIIKNWLIKKNNFLKDFTI